MTQRKAQVPHLHLCGKPPVNKGSAHSDAQPALPRAGLLTVNSGKSSDASLRAWCRGRGCSAGGSQYRWCRVSVFTTQGPSPIMATTSSLDIARSRFSPWNMGSLISHSASPRELVVTQILYPRCGRDGPKTHPQEQG
jgi:hypothetical protein